MAPPANGNRIGGTAEELNSCGTYIFGLVCSWAKNLGFSIKKIKISIAYTGFFLIGRYVSLTNQIIKGRKN